MASGQCPNCPVWREWGSLCGLIEQLPLHFQQGVDTANLEITCISSLPKHLVLGTNVGLVYLAHIPSLSLMRLKCENPLSPITDVSALSTVDEMIAAGSLDGTISIFQLPRSPYPQASPSSVSSAEVTVPDNKGVVFPQPLIKRFTVGHVHRTRITCFHWSRNGMRLFCGDAQGVVSEININYQTSECTAKELWKEEYSIVQLSYTFQLLAVSSLERTFILNLSTGSIQQVGKKPRKYPGGFGCLWSSSVSQASSTLYTSRPGLRIWSSNKEGEVLQTHIIKELPDKAQIELFTPSSEKPRQGENFSFGILQNIDSYMVTYTPHWLFIVDINNLTVCNYSGQFGRIIQVTVSEKEIFILDGSRHITCLSIEPPDIGERRPISVGPNFLESENLKELKSRIVSQGTGLLGQIARMGTTVAAKVSEHAKPSIVVGHDIRKPSQDFISNTSNIGAPLNGLFNKTTVSNPTNIEEQRKEYGHQRSSSSGGVISELQQKQQQQYESSTSSIIPPRMVQSVSNLLPSLLSPQSLVKTFGKTPSVNNVEVPGVVPSNITAFEEVVTSSQIVASDNLDIEPLVVPIKSKKKAKKKQADANSSPEIENPTQFKLIDSSPCSGSLSISSSPSNVSHQSILNSENSSPENPHIFDDKTFSTKLEETSNDERSVTNLDNISVGNFHLDDLDPSNVDTRTYEDFKSNIEKNESLLAENLDLGCLRMDHEPNESDEIDCNNLKQGNFDRENSIESNKCSTPSTLKEASPQPEGDHSGIFGQYYNESFPSEDNCESFNDRKTNSNEDNLSLASNDGGERLGSNFSEDRISCLSYGPPSGSSLVSLTSNKVPSIEGQDPVVNEPSAMLVVLDSSDIADISWSYSPIHTQESHKYDQEQMCGGWIKYNLPSNILSFSVSENVVTFIDNQSSLFAKQTNSEHSWKKFRLTAKATQISQSPSGNILWVLYGTNAYLAQIPNLESLPFAKTMLAASNVLQVSVDDELTWFLKLNHQVCVMPNVGGKVPSIISCEEFRLVKIVCHAKVVWGLTDKGELVFRIGISSHSKSGHAWGFMKNHDFPVKDFALGPGQLGWIIDERGCVYFRPGVCVEYPQGQNLKWWQVRNVGAI